MRSEIAGLSEGLYAILALREGAGLEWPRWLPRPLAWDWLMTDLFDRFDRMVVAALERWSVQLLRLSLGIVFLWFGGLKVFGVSPVSDLVAATVYWVDPDWFVVSLGVVEMLVGAGLILRRAMRIILAVFLAQMAGTFLVVILLPDIAFQDGNPLKLTVEGEFVIKNLVLLSAGLVVGSMVRRDRESLAARQPAVE
jgi:uncharacterized membrane protein YkgB